MSKKKEPRKYQAPGEPFEKWKKRVPFEGPNKTTRTTRVVNPGEKIPFGPGIPGRGAAR